MYRLMIIEDDIKLSILTKEYLEKCGYTVSEILDFTKVEQQIEKDKPELIILDINLPYYDGYYLCRAIRSKCKIPIIITSARSGDMDQILAIELGADDYIIKPFKLEILLAKVKASLRRVYGEYSTNESTDLNIKGLVLDEKSFKLTYKGNSLGLSKNEFKLMKKFIDNRGKVIKREELFQELWDDYNFVTENTLNVNITRIKNKFLDLGIKDIIETKRGVGYLFNDLVLEESYDE